MKHQKRGEAMKTNPAVFALLLVIGAVSAVRGQTSLPFAANFDSQTNGHAVVKGDAWAYTVTAYVTNTPSPVDGSALAVYAPDGMTLNITNGVAAAYSNVWWSSYAKVNVHTNPPSIGDAVAAFYVNSAAQLMASSNGTWVAVAESVATNDWIGFAVHLDYDNKVWDIYMTDPGFTHGAALKKRNTTFMLNFNNNDSTQLTVAEITGETYIDSVAVARSSVPVTGSSPANLANTTGTQLMLDDFLSGAALNYFGNGGTLDGAFGDALASVLVNGDKVNVFDAAGQSWRIFTFDGQAFNAPGGASYTVAGTTIYPTTGIYFDLADSGDRLDSFFAAYENAEPSINNASVAGDGKWNLLAIPFTVTDAAIVDGAANTKLLFGITPVSGDRIFLRRNGAWIALRYTTLYGGRWTRFGTQAATEQFPAGCSFWYYRYGSDDTWMF